MATPNTGRAGPKPSRGLSLIEILVGLVIGMIGIVVIFQVLAVSEDRKRTTVQGSDSQSAGSIALYSLQRDVHRALNGPLQYQRAGIISDAAHQVQTARRAGND